MGCARAPVAGDYRAVLGAGATRRRRPIFAGHTLIGPQNQPEAMPFDQFAGKLINHARLDPIGGITLS